MAEIDDLREQLTETRKVVLKAKLGDDSISDAELREFMRLQEGV
jgi:hypothetical protein